MWFKKKRDKKEWTIRTDPVCQYSDCINYRPWKFTYNNYDTYLGTLPPVLQHCFMCIRFKRTDCYIKK